MFRSTYAFYLLLKERTSFSRF